MQIRTLAISLTLAGILAGLVFSLFFFQFSSDFKLVWPAPFQDQSNKLLDSKKDKEDISIIFTGDVMLGRDVEIRLLKEENGYALSAIKGQLLSDLIVMNFEASVPQTHIPTKHMEMRFSVRPGLLAELKLPTQIYLSLANNHSLDYGSKGYVNTIKVLEEQGFKAFGHPTRIGTSSVSVFETKGQRIAILYINATYGSPDIDSIRNVMSQLLPTELTVAYVHWGTEYELINDDNQLKLAHTLIDNGFDLIIGHHPHVVQNIEKYKDGLIIYSLGNFIFDQYWMDSVREGLLVKLTGKDRDWEVSLIPVESSTVRVQPREIQGVARQAFLDNLAERSSVGLNLEIKQGKILLQF